MQLTSASPALLGALLALALSVPAGAQMPAEGTLTYVSSPDGTGDGELLAPVEFLDLRVREMVEELERNSPTTASMLLAIRRAGFPLSFGTFADLAAEMQQEYRSWSRGTRNAAGYMAPVVRSGPGFSHPLTTVKINVAVNLRMLEELFADADTVESDSLVSWPEVRRLEMLSVLAHEIVHAYGLAMSGGDPRHGCHDPYEDERPQDSCVMIGENVVRKEIGAPLDWDYGFPSLASLAERYSEAEARRAKILEIAAFRLPRPLEPELPRRRVVEP
jgi:hypothetical protein